MSKPSIAARPSRTWGRHARLAARGVRQRQQRGIREHLRIDHPGHDGDGRAADDGRGRSLRRLLLVRPHSRGDRGPLLRRRGCDPQRHPRGQAGDHPAPRHPRPRGGRVQSARQRCHPPLALRRRRRLLRLRVGVNGAGGGSGGPPQGAVALAAGASRPTSRPTCAVLGSRTPTVSPVQDGLPGLVPRPHRAHPREGPRRQAHRADHAALIRRGLREAGLRLESLLGRHGTRRLQRRRPDLRRGPRAELSREGDGVLGVISFDVETA